MISTILSPLPHGCLYISDLPTFATRAFEKVYESIVLPSSKCAWTPAFCRTGDSWSRLGRTSLFGMEK